MWFGTRGLEKMMVEEAKGGHGAMKGWAGKEGKEEPCFVRKARPPTQTTLGAAVWQDRERKDPQQVACTPHTSMDKKHIGTS